MSMMTALAELNGITGADELHPIIERSLRYLTRQPP
jgi:hypothetical protein